MRTGIALVVIVLMANLAGVVATAGTSNEPKPNHTNQNDPIPHSNQDMVPLQIDTEEEVVLREIALIYVSLDNLESFGMIAPGTAKMFALASDLGTDCVSLANALCGKGGTCCLCICEDGNGTKQCNITCQGADGSCQACPTCACSSLFTG